MHEPPTIFIFVYLFLIINICHPFSKSMILKDLPLVYSVSLVTCLILISTIWAYEGDISDTRHWPIFHISSFITLLSKLTLDITNQNSIDAHHSPSLALLFILLYLIVILWLFGFTMFAQWRHIIHPQLQSKILPAICIDIAVLVKENPHKFVTAT